MSLRHISTFFFIVLFYNHNNINPAQRPVLIAILKLVLFNVTREGAYFISYRFTFTIECLLNAYFMTKDQQMSKQIQLPLCARLTPKLAGLEPTLQISN